MGTSHPAVRFEQLAAVEGPLWRLPELRSEILADVVQRTYKDLKSSPFDMILGEALFYERQRLKREPFNVFTWHRHQNDRKLWRTIQRDLLKPSMIADRKPMLEAVLNHYAQEIGGKFDPRVYRFTTGSIPLLFNWLLNAASVRRIFPWKWTEALQDRIQILGEVSHLQDLSKKGTVLMVPTHQSNIDSILIGYIIYLMSMPPFAYGAGLNLYSNPVLSYFMSNLGAYTVDRKKTNEIYKETLKNYSTRILREGIHSIFFPGGGRSRSGAIEKKVKLGLLGTALEAQRLNLRENRDKPNIYVVPMVTSYHFVLEASSLIEDYLAEQGKHRFIRYRADESWQPTKVLNFFWKLFSAKSGITVRIGKPMDIFGNFVDEQGHSIGPNGTIIDPRRWLSTRGELYDDPQRDREYTRELGNKISERFHRENTVLTSHLVAFAFFDTLRKQYADLDLFRFLRISLAQRTMPMDNFLHHAEKYHRAVRALADKGKLYVSDRLQTDDTRRWVEDGIRNLGLFHGNGVLRQNEGTIYTEDMNLLYYYRNRLLGYGLEFNPTEQAR